MEVKLIHKKVDDGFDNKRLQAWINLTPKYCDQSDHIPTIILERAIELFNELSHQGLVDSFETYNDDFKQIWQRLKDSDDHPPIKVLIAQGVPKLRGVSVEFAHDDRKQFMLTITTPAVQSQEWSSGWLYHCVRNKIRAINPDSDFDPNPAQLTAAWIRHKEGIEPIKNMKLAPRNKTNPTWDGAPYRVVVFPHRLEVHLVMGRFDIFEHQDNVDQLFKDVKGGIKKILRSRDEKINFRLLKKGVLFEIARAKEGVQRLGIGCPINVLAAFGTAEAQPEEAREREGKYSRQDAPNEKGNNPWANLMIRELMAIKGATDDPKWMVEKCQFPISLDAATEALNNLKKGGFVKYDSEQKKWVQTEKHITTGDDAAGMSVMQYHLTMIDMGKESLKYPARRRDISALTLNVTDELAAQIKQTIRAFRKRLIAMCENCKDPDQVYQINIQMFPFFYRGGEP